MSGGHFNYIQGRIMEAAKSVHEIIAINESDKSSIFDEYPDYSEETLNKFKETRDTLIKASKMLQRVDWLVSDDDSEESFHRRWKSEVEG